uniref:Uncharacterized protein MANES_13G136100 n=1 Tax=Rhizophora mucronata TaxID=61149 RepID=A0A2P2KJL6_RHIMU
MGGQSSKKRGGDAPSSSLKINANSHFTADLTSYEAACANDPDLQSFDNALHERTSRVIDTLVTGVNFRSLSIDSLKEFTNFLLEMNQEALHVILESREDIWKNQELFDLVEEYLKISIMTMDFCTALSNCLKRARNSQIIIQIAVKQFEEEVRLQDGVLEKYVKTLKALQDFKAAGDPFTEEFFQLFQSLHLQHSSMLEKLRFRKSKLDKKLHSVKVCRMVSNIVFVTAFVSSLILSVVVAAIAAPPIVVAISGAISAPIGMVGKWVDSLWSNYEKELRAQSGLIISMQVGTSVTITDMDNIRVLVDKLEIGIESIMQNAKLALREEDTLKLVIDVIKRKLEVLTESIDILGKRADKFSGDIRQARTVILQRIIRYPG